jgi:hypothetical protein
MRARHLNAGCSASARIFAIAVSSSWFINFIQISLTW